MRLLIVGFAVFFTTTAVAQSRWTLSAGPEWGFSVGGRLRAEYDVFKPAAPLRLRLELGGYWEPTQNQYGTYVTGGNGEFAGSRQSVDLTFGVAASLTPLPNARVAPYVTLGIMAQQMWRHGDYFITTPDASRSGTFSGSLGRMIVPLGLGMRARMGSRMVQIEMRRWEQRSALLVGTSLPF
jgi:hypothetical protein